MKKHFLCFLTFSTAFSCVCSQAAALESLPSDSLDTHKIAVQNSILAKVNGTTISMLDVKKKMDFVFHQNYPHLASSAQAHHQFYEGSWRPLLMEMIDHQLLLADAEEKEVKLTDGEIRESMESKFGPNIMLTLDTIGLTYDEAWKMTKEELLVQRMTWWFIHSKAVSQVTPQDIRQAFRLHLKENPAYQEWKYRVISIRGDNAEQIAQNARDFLLKTESSPETLKESLQNIDPSIQVSSEFFFSDKQISEAHRAALLPLNSGTYSLPIIQKNKPDNKTIARIFYLYEKTSHPAPQFEDLAHNLRNELIQKAVVRESSVYMEKLRKHYGFDIAHIKEKIPDDFHPFSLE